MLRKVSKLAFRILAVAVMVAAMVPYSQPIVCEHRPMTGMHHSPSAQVAGFTMVHATAPCHSPLACGVVPSASVASPGLVLTAAAVEASTSVSTPRRANQNVLLLRTPPPRV